jgi:integrase/recombinase XerC
MGLKSYLKKGAKKISGLFGRIKRSFSRSKTPRKRRARLKHENAELLLSNENEFLSLDKSVENKGSASSNALTVSHERRWRGPSNLHAVDEFAAVQLSEHTKRAYQNDLRDFFKFLLLRFAASSQLSSIGETSPSAIAEYRDFLIHEKKLGQNSVTRKLAVLKSFFKYALSRGWIGQNPAEFVRGFRQNQESKTGFLNDEEVLTLLTFVDALPEERLSFFQTKVLIKTLVFLGLRRSEARSIRLGHMEYSDGLYHLRVQGKGARERRLPLSPPLLENWSRWIGRILPGEEIPAQGFSESPASWLVFLKKHSEQPLFINTRARSFDQPLSTSEMGHIVRKVGRKAGIAFRVSPHMLRATAITNALDAGATHRGVQQMAGWTSPLMISRYDKRLNDPKFSAVFHVKYAGWSVPQQTVKMKTTADSEHASREEGKSSNERERNDFLTSDPV